MIHRHLECELGGGGVVDILLNISFPQICNRIIYGDPGDHTGGPPLPIHLPAKQFFRNCHIMMKIGWCTILFKEEHGTTVFFKLQHQPWSIMARYAVPVMDHSASKKGPIHLFYRYCK